MSLGFLFSPGSRVSAPTLFSSDSTPLWRPQPRLPPPPRGPRDPEGARWRRQQSDAIAWIRPAAPASARTCLLAAATLAHAIPVTADQAAGAVERANATGARSVLIDSGVPAMDEYTLKAAGLLLVRVTGSRRTNVQMLDGTPSVATAGVALAPLLIEVENGTRAEFTERSDASGCLTKITERDERPFHERLVAWLVRVYLPVGYPHTVTQDYLSYTAYRVVQNLASAIMTVLSTECLLYGLGLGSKVKATAAATAWVVKDGLGYFTKVVFGSYCGGKLDSDPKSWRISADITEDIGGALEVVMPVLSFPGSFIVIASLTNVLKGIAAMTGTATRHVIYRQLVAGGSENIADVATKGESQGVTCKMLGLGSGIAISSTLGQNYSALLTAYAICAVIHLSANWRSMKCVQFSVFNKQRLAIALHYAFDNLPVPTPTEVSRYERIILPPWIGYQPHVVIGSRVDQAISNANHFKKAASLFKGEKFLITRTSFGKLNVLLRRDASSIDCASAYYVVQRFLKRVDCAGASDFSSKVARVSSSEYEAEMKSSLLYMRKNVKRFLASCRDKGWNTSQLLLQDSSIRAEW